MDYLPQFGSENVLGHLGGENPKRRRRISDLLQMSRDLSGRVLILKLVRRAPVNCNGG